ncbi:MAG TPA: dihydrofolate reductase family protein [Bryobacteraceae bacterium]|nr:dihydrofolate reductase family protein [Bryobacteraceae bacterium]
MRKLLVFNNVSLDGCFVDAKSDMSWAHKHDAEWAAFTESNAKGGGVLVFGRATYQMMAGYWPTPMAAKNSPGVAERMNQLSKIVFSRTLNEVTWANTTLIKEDMAGAVRKMKAEDGPDLVIMGSGSIVSQLSQERLIDEYQIVLNPVALGHGRSLFEGMLDRLSLKLMSSRVFGNGNVFLCYEPIA